MTTKAKDKADGEAPEEAVTTVEDTPLCGAPHHLPLLAHVTCTEPASDPDLPPGTPGHQHRYQDGDAIYVWS